MGGQGWALDPHWIPVDDRRQAYTVVMNGPQFTAFQAWLREQGQCVRSGPDLYVSHGQEPVYSVALRPDVADSEQA